MVQTIAKRSAGLSGIRELIDTLKVFDSQVERPALDIALIVPTMNRSEFVIRLLTYYRDLAFQGQICIGDSSNSEHIARTKAAVRSMGHQLNISYEEYPGVGDAACMEKLLDLVNASYVAYLGDDDFLIPSALQKCIGFLDSHPDHSGAHGLAAIIGVEPSGPYGRVVWSSFYRQAILQEDTGSRRLMDHLTNYYATIFSVHRVETWRAMATGISSIPNRTFAGELLPSCIPVVEGKIEQLDCFYLVRQTHDLRYDLPTTSDWIASPLWQESYELFRDRLAGRLTQQDGITLEGAKEVVEQSLRSYIDDGLQRTERTQNSRQPNWAGARLRSAARAVLRLPKTREAFSFLPAVKKTSMSLQALSNPSSPYHADVMPIIRSITARGKAVVD